MTGSKSILDRPELKATPLRAPEGYFDTLGERVMSRVRESERPRKVTFRAVWRPVAAAASLAAIALGLWRFTAPADTDYAETAQQQYLIYLGVSERQIAEYGSAAQSETPSQDEIMEYLAYNDLSGAYIYDRMAEAE